MGVNVETFIKNCDNYAKFAIVSEDESKLYDICTRRDVEDSPYRKVEVLYWGFDHHKDQFVLYVENGMD